jgi:two-component system phosphate regulon response regulator PhoB
MGRALRSHHDRDVKSDRRRARHSTPVVLIVEDDAAIADPVAEAIQAAGYQTIHVRDGWQALDVLKQEQPAVLLIDMLLPGMGGSELLRFVRTSPTWSRIPRVIMTGTNDPMIGVREDAPVLYKPLDLDSLVAVVRRYCDRARPQISATGHAGG